MKQHFLNHIQMLPRALLLAVLLAAAYLFVRDNGKGRAKEKLLSLLRQPWLVQFLVYTAFLLMLAIFYRTITEPYHNIFSHFWFRRDREWDTEILENILVFVPYTFLYLQAFRPDRAWKAAFRASAALTLLIELSQLIMWLGSFQLSDILYNIIGGMIGCALWVVLVREHCISRAWQALLRGPGRRR